jgi:hypothetical protein
LLGACLVAANAPGAAGAAEFRPFVDFSGYPPPKLEKISNGSHASQISLGFVTAEGGRSCTPTWGGYKEYQAAGNKPYQLANVNSFRQSGGEPIASFGGQAGTELASTCQSVGALENAYAKVISTYDLRRVDFDIEGAAVTQHAAGVRRAAAVASLQSAAQKAGGGLAVSLTLPVNPDGLTSDGRDVVKTFDDAGVNIDVVNVMAMDYGGSVAPHPAGKMGAYAVSAGKHTASQLTEILSLSQAASHRIVGVTPMIGINDVASEIFTLKDARKLAKFAKSFGLGQLSMWQLARDGKCKRRSSTTQEHCSGVDQHPWQFSRILG